MEKVRIGVIGCGGIATNKHLPAYQNNPNAELVAFCDNSLERAERVKTAFGTENSSVYVDYNEMLENEEIDAVLVLTHNSVHCRMAVDALNAGKHVLVEKPMALTYEEAQQMIAASKKAGKLLTVGYQNRFNPETLYLKELAQADTFGEIYYAEATAIRRRGVPTWGVFLNEKKQGGGPLIDIGTHTLDLTLFMMNNFEPAYCVGRTFHKLNKETKMANAWGDWDPERFSVEDSAFGFVVMKNGAVINLRSSWALNYPNPREAGTLICGTKAGAEYNGTTGDLTINGVMNNRQYKMTPDFSTGGVAYFEGAGGTKPNELEAACFLNAILGKGELYVKPEQAACVTKILEGIYISAKTGKPYYFD